MRNKKKRNLRLNFRLTTFDTLLIAGVSFLLLFVLLLFGIYTTNVKNSESELIHMMLERMSINQKTQFEEYIDEKVQVLEGLTEFPQVYQMQDKEIQAFLQHKAPEFGFEYFFVMKTDGYGFYFDEGDIYRFQKDEPFYQTIMEQDIYLTEPFYSDKSPAITTVCVSIYNPAHQKVGVLCGALNLESIQAIIENSEMLLKGNVFILNESGNYISSSSHSDLHDKSVNIFYTSGSDLDLITDTFDTQYDHAGNIKIDGTDYQAYVTYLPDFNWVLVQIIPVNEVTARFQYIKILQSVMTILTIVLFLCIARIIYSWRKSDNKIYTDVLTRCGSRAACLSLLEALEKQRNTRISIIYMDLNNFKFVNDTYGHDEGDQLLRIFGATLKNVFGSIGFVGRHGGDEFVVIVTDLTDTEIEALCTEVSEILLQESKKLAFPYTMSTSYGYASREPGDNALLDTIVQQADEQMYKQKLTSRKERAAIAAKNQ